LSIENTLRLDFSTTFAFLHVRLIIVEKLSIDGKKTQIAIIGKHFLRFSSQPCKSNDVMQWLLVSTVNTHTL